MGETQQYYVKTALEITETQGNQVNVIATINYSSTSIADMNGDGRVEFSITLDPTFFFSNSSNFVGETGPVFTLGFVEITRTNTLTGEVVVDSRGPMFEITPVIITVDETENYNFELLGFNTPTITGSIDLQNP